MVTCLSTQFSRLCAAVRLSTRYLLVLVGGQFRPPCLVGLYRHFNNISCAPTCTQKQDVAGPSGRQAAHTAKPAQSDAPASKAAAAGGGNDFGRLYNLVGSLCEAEPEAKQRMLEQLEPSQRCAAKLDALVSA